jgi:hypothetical protein
MRIRAWSAGGWGTTTGGGDRRCERKDAGCSRIEEDWLVPEGGQREARTRVEKSSEREERVLPPPRRIHFHAARS